MLAVLEIRWLDSLILKNWFHCAVDSERGIQEESAEAANTTHGLEALHLKHALDMQLAADVNRTTQTDFPSNNPNF